MVHTSQLFTHIVSIHSHPPRQYRTKLVAIPIVILLSFILYKPALADHCSLGEIHTTVYRGGFTLTAICVPVGPSTPRPQGPEPIGPGTGPCGHCEESGFAIAPWVIFAQFDQDWLSAPGLLEDAEFMMGNGTFEIIKEEETVLRLELYNIEAGVE